MNRVFSACLFAANLSGKTLCSLLAIALGTALVEAPLAPAQDSLSTTLTQISSDPFTVGPGQHATEVEPHMLANGSTLVAAFQTGRIVPGGATAIGWATSTDGGTSWSHGFLPGLTTGNGGGPYDAASDPAVAFDARHSVWMIASLPISNTTQTPAVVVSRSTDGGFTWDNPVSVGPNVASSDKNWIVCDSNSASPFYGNCYVEWDNPFTGDGILMSTSSDGGLTWSPAIGTANRATGIGGQPLVQPSGTVVVPIETNSMSSFTSTDGGKTWSKPVTISSIQSHTDAGGIRSGPLPTATVDGAGTVWVVWEDCRFRSNCSTNDLVYSTSSDGVTWSKVTRVPIDPTSSTVDHFIPGIGIDPATSGATTHVAIHYYFYPKSKCTQSTCQLFVGYVSSHNGGKTWNAPVKLTGAMQLTWLANSQNGLMVGDYIATVFNNGVPHGVFAVAAAKSGSTFNEAMNTAQGLSVAEAGPQFSSAGDKPLHKLSDVIEKERPEKGVMPPSKRAAKRSAK
ncbi:MAG TPA: sialidase family protein [Candidatus Dormibacteraeota bacterium]|nr:sialidase family protein [Candidatus Dormibacteraeota bacterium]